MATAMASSRPVASSSAAHVPTNYGALSTLVIVFFFWGFIASGNSVFIPFVNISFISTSFKASWLILHFIRRII